MCNAWIHKVAARSACGARCPGAEAGRADRGSGPSSAMCSLAGVSVLCVLVFLSVQWSPPQDLWAPEPPRESTSRRRRHMGRAHSHGHLPAKPTLPVCPHSFAQWSFSCAPHISGPQPPGHPPYYIRMKGSTSSALPVPRHFQEWGDPGVGCTPSTSYLWVLLSCPHSAHILQPPTEQGVLSLLRI